MTLGPGGTKFFSAPAVPVPVATVAPLAEWCVMAVVTCVVQLAEALGLADASALDVVAFGPRV